MVATLGNIIPWPFLELITRNSNSSSLPLLYLYGMHLQDLKITRNRNFRFRKSPNTRKNLNRKQIQKRGRLTLQPGVDLDRNVEAPFPSEKPNKPFSPT